MAGEAATAREERRSWLRGEFPRYPGDAIVVVVGLAIAVGLSLPRLEHISDAERDVFEAVNHLPTCSAGPCKM
jgi:hypothetical protein